MTPGDLRPLTARSVIASTLLGTHPPQMSGRLLVAVVTRFGISEGTARVALSRMVDRNELVNDSGVYSLTGPLLERQRRQDTARVAPPGDWDGSWRVAVVAGPPADQKVRQARRDRLRQLKLGEFREGVWMRPANLPSLNASPNEDLWFFTAQPDADPVVLASMLWDLDSWAEAARGLIAGLSDATSGLESDNDDDLADGFMLSAAVLRHLVADPELPSDLWPSGWPSRELRDAYDEFDAAYRRLLRRFFDDQK